MVSILPIYAQSPRNAFTDAASIISIFIIAFTMTGTLLIRYFGLRLGIRHDMRAGMGAIQSTTQARVIPAKLA